LQPANLLSIFQPSLSGTLSIPSLELSAAVGVSTLLGTVTVSIHKPGDPTQPLTFQNFTELTAALQTAFTDDVKFSGVQNFLNITPGMTLNMRPQLVSQLSTLGGSGVDDALHTPLPLLNKSVADLANLGAAFGDFIGTPGGQAQVQTARKFQDY